MTTRIGHQGRLLRNAAYELKDIWSPTVKGGIHLKGWKLMAIARMKVSNLFDQCTYRKHHRWIRLQFLIAALIAAAVPLAHAMPQDSPRSEIVNVEALMTRVGPPSPLAIKEFKNAGMEGVRPHTLTASERTTVEVTLASLPLLTRRVLEKKLHYLAFVDGIPGEGTGLTSPVAKTGLYDITLRASILDEPLSIFLTTKERRLFTNDGTGLTIMVSGTGTDALTYVLLHESAHVVDNSCGITANPRSRFVADIWASQKRFVPRLEVSVVAATAFHGGRPLRIGQAAAVYDAMAQTGFVSLYATHGSLDDFAELVAWREILVQHQGNLVIEVKDASGKSLRRWEPLTFPEVQKRFEDVDKLLASPATCRGVV